MFNYRTTRTTDNTLDKPTTFKSADPCYLVSRLTYSTQEAGQGGRGDHQSREHVFVLLPDVNQDWGNSNKC